MGVYVECYRFSTFIVTDSVYYKYQYSKTYTLCGGLNRLQVYVTEIKEKQIFERIRWQLRIFESVFYKSLIRACSFGNWYVMTFVNSKLTEITTNFYFIVSEDIQKEFRCISSRHWPLWYTWIGYQQVNGPPRTLAVSLTWITDITVPTEFPRR